MTVTVTAVPESITRPQLVAWLAEIGVDADEVPAPTSIVLSRECIEIEVYAFNAEGNRFPADALDEDGGRYKLAARHKIVIPIVETDTPASEGDPG